MKPSVAETNCENLCESKGYVTISRNPGSQAPCCHLFFFILSFIISYITMGAYWPVAVHGPQFPVRNPRFILIGYEKKNFPNDLSFSSCKSIRGKIRESNRPSLLSLLCATLAANKTKRSSICFCWESFNNRWVPNTTPMNIMVGRLWQNSTMSWYL